MEKVIDIKTFKVLSRQFRRCAGDLLNSEDTYEALRLAKRFLMFINDEPILADFIEKNHSEKYNFEEILQARGYTEKFDIPIQIAEEISYIYQLLKYSTARFDRYDSITNGYAFYKGAKYADQIREFNKEVVKLLVNHITDYLEEMAIEMGIDEKPNAKVLVQGNVGQLNFSETGDIEAHQTNNNGNQELLKIAQELIEMLKGTDFKDQEAKEDAIDFVDQARREIEAGQTPKPSLLRRTKEALSNIKTTVDDTASLAIHIEKFISFLGNIPI